MSLAPRFMRHLVCSLLFVSLLCAGCRTASRADRHRPETGWNAVYRPPTEEELNDRVAELERAGHSKEAATQKARREFARDAWRYEGTSSWHAEKAREARSRQREQMEKDLAKLDEL